MKIIKIFLFSIFFYLPVVGQIKLPRLIRDSMVLQRDQPIKIWGWANKNEKIKIRFNHQQFKTQADQAGNWKMELPKMIAGGPYRMELDGSNHISIQNILIGDVWICSGQSNMVHQMGIHNVRYAKEIAEANYPEIRHFFVPNQYNLQNEEKDLNSGYWKSANPQDLLEFSAVAYFFAQKIYTQYHIPIGLVNASWGGTPIESWISKEGFNEFPQIQNIRLKNADTAYLHAVMKNISNPQPEQEDEGIRNKWFAENYFPTNWHTINVPGFWEDQGIKDLDGVVWYRKEFEIPRAFNKKSSRLFLGRIVDADQVYINGSWVGKTTYQYPQRRYAIPENVLHDGKNIITVRVQNNAGKGGFVPDKPYSIFSGKDTVDLKGTWLFKVSEVYEPNKNLGSSFSFQSQPASLYNSMIAPLTNFACKGFLWYQGETNSSRAKEYTFLQPALIKDWRNKWKSPEAPFLYVQLPGFMDRNYSPSESQWAEFREAQMMSLQVPNTGMAVAIDLGEWNDIHPDRKKEVGDRLALLAMELAYHEKGLVSNGPKLQNYSIEGNRIQLQFSNIGGGLRTSDGDPPHYFSIAGADKKFIWAKAMIEQNRVIVWNEKIAEPKYVRYAWADNPEGANLINQEGFPALPFRTDQ